MTFSDRETMAKNIQAIRGMHDILPDQSPLWQRLEDAARQVLDAYGYAEIRTPLVEVTELFKRSIGEVTDIVEKEMYSFEDRNGDSLSLRPEGTASCVRAAIEHGTARPAPTSLVSRPHVPPRAPPTRPLPPVPPDRGRGFRTPRTGHRPGGGAAHPADLVRPSASTT